MADNQNKGLSYLDMLTVFVFAVCDLPTGIE